MKITKGSQNAMNNAYAANCFLFYTFFQNWIQTAVYETSMENYVFSLNKYKVP